MTAPMAGQDAAAVLRDLTEAVATVAGRILGLPATPGTAGDATTEGK